ncbi:MAG TPA: amino acid adenylation domain-containing protein, partial [Flavobacteriales bacterium]|nr:amino acid adenylation domain-containing protein [Flavobacteriales bacterium]
AVLDAFDNQKYTFGTLLRKLNVPREAGRIPLVPVVFNIDMNMDDGVAFDGLAHRFISNPRNCENFELFLNATGNEEHLVVEWSYNTDLFDPSTIRNWMNELLRLIGRISTAPSASIAELLSDAALSGDQEMPAPAWVGTSTAYPRETGIGTLFDEVATAHPDRVALVLADQRMTYGELQDRVHRLGAHLAELGVKRGDPVGLCMDRSFEMVTAMLAILRSGACFVPFDPSYPAERLTFMFQDTDVKVLVTQRHLQSALPAHGARVVLPASLGSPKGTMAAAIGGGNDAAYVMYTSGSTGKPKGVVVPHRAIVRLVREQDFLPFGPDLTFLQLSNISFDASTLEIWGALLNGAKLVLQPQQKPTLVEITDAIRQHGVTTVWFTVGLFNLLVDEHLDRLRGLKHILTGGDVLSVPHVKRALRKLGPGVLINGYGPTENTTFTCCHAINDEGAIKSSVPIGRPIHNTTVHVLDEHRRPVPVGRKGELYTGGDGVALGYWKRDDLTAERFITDPFTSRPGARLYRTGDLVRWLPDGTIEFIGRTDDQVKVRGFRIELGEIENALNDHALVKDRVVVVRNDIPGEKQLVCYLVPNMQRDAEDADAREVLIAKVREHLRSDLPDHMVPTAFVVLSSFPLNPNGKVDRKALPAPELRQRAMRAQHVAPRDPMERTIAEIWGQFLGTDRIGANDNFFDLGGHSLIGIQLLARIEERFQQALPLKSLFEAPTISEFAKLLREGEPHTEWKNLSLIQPKGDRTPLFCVHGDEANHFIPRYLGKDRPFYAFFHQGEDGRRLEYTTVEAIAAHFISELRRARPHGPYLLCGYSFGGIVAYEMAQQLTASGETIGMLALFDTYSPSMHVKAMNIDRKVYDTIKKTVFRSLAKYFLKRGKPLPAKLRHFHIIDTYDQAVQRYVPAPYTGMLTVIKAEHSWGPNEMGWTELAKGGLDVVVSPGDHYTMILEPDVRRMVDALAARINDAEARS